MKLVDVNILVGVVNQDSPNYSTISNWWLTAINNDQQPIGLCTLSLVGFIRIVTNARILKKPLDIKTAKHDVMSWINHHNVRQVTETSDHHTLMFDLLEAANQAGDLVPDAHLAALAISHNATLVSADNDFAKFPGLQWENPLADPI